MEWYTHFVDEKYIKIPIQKVLVVFLPQTIRGFLPKRYFKSL